MSKTTKKERFIAGGVAVFMLLSTVGMYVAMALGSKNPQPVAPEQKIAQQKMMEKYQKYLDEQKKYMDKISQELSKKYYSEFKQYQNNNAKFDNGSIKEVTVKDLKVGTGAELKKGVEYRAYYLGWKSDGKIFDSSFDKDSLKAPLNGGEGLIEGWKEGIEGMKIGGIRQIEIPAAKAYGDKKQGDIPANSDLKFIIMAINPMTKEEKDKMPKMEL